MNSSPPAFSSWAGAAGRALLLVVAGAMLAHVSSTMHPRFLTLDQAVQSQAAILNRTPAVLGGSPEAIATWRNRIMVPYAIKGVSALFGGNFSRAYLLIRWITACGALFSFRHLLRRVLRLAPGMATVAALGLAFSLLPTFLHIYEIPSDFLDAAFFSLLTWLAIEGRKPAFALILLVGLLNRESAIFALGVWFFLHAAGHPRARAIRETGWCALCGVVGTAEVLGLRAANALQGNASLAAGMQPFAPTMMWEVNYRMLREWLARPSYSHPYFFLGGYVLAAGLVLAGARPLPALHRRLLAAAAVIYAFSAFSNNLDELRVYIPSLVLVDFSLVFVLFARPAGIETADRSTN